MAIIGNVSAGLNNSRCDCWAGRSAPLVVDALERALVEYSKHFAARTDTEKPLLFS